MSVCFLLIVRHREPKAIPGIRPEMFFDYLIDLVADTPRFVDCGYPASGSDLKIQDGSEAVVIVVGLGTVPSFQSRMWSL